ncbi:MAG: hypothetical protein D4R84_01545 [Rhodocyclaceae bacterium]|nr:MAG: hypothetical protein D4R84_01545 [Rhodocyclaceae bacterium]
MQQNQIYGLRYDQINRQICFNHVEIDAGAKSAVAIANASVTEACSMVRDVPSQPNRNPFSCNIIKRAP